MHNVFENIRDTGVCPIITTENQYEKLRQDPKGFAEAFAAAGLKTIELAARKLPARSFEALEILEEVTPTLKAAGMIVGLGTASTTVQVERARQAGVDFIVSPGFDDELEQYCLGKSIPYVPGCETSTELLRARQRGFRVLKYYPATLFSKCSLFCATYPDTMVIASDVANVEDNDVLREWYRSEVKALVFGNRRLFQSLNLTAGSWETVSDDAKKLVEFIKLLRS